MEDVGGRPSDVAGARRCVGGGETRRSSLLLPEVAEECAALDELGDFGGHHAFPGTVAGGYPSQHVAAEDRQALCPVVVEVDEAAPPGEVVIQRLQLRQDLDVVHGLQFVVWGWLERIDIELELVFE